MATDQDWRTTHPDEADSESEASSSPCPSVAGDLFTFTSDESVDSEPAEEPQSSSWKAKLEFILSCLGYTLGLGNIWRFPYLVYKNGGGTFFIPYLIVLVFCGVPLVFMEMALGQYASLGPITIWKAVPIFKGIGYSMMIIQAIIAVYYNMINAWAFSYLIASMSAPLPWSVCGQSWNTKDCRGVSTSLLSNCSWINDTYLHQVNKTENTCFGFLLSCINPENDTEAFSRDNVTQCVSWLEGQLGVEISNTNGMRLAGFKEPSEEYFYYKVLGESGSLQSLGEVQWQLALYLLLCWAIVFLSLLKGSHPGPKFAYAVVIVPFLLMLILLIQAAVIDEHHAGVKFYVTPDWNRLLDLQVWMDATSQVFFSLSACGGGLCALSSYHKFYNNVYRDAVIICVADTVFSFLAGLLVFFSLGIVEADHKPVHTAVTEIFDPNVGFVFMAFPNSVDHFGLPALWSILFFIMVLLLGLGTMINLVETIVTAVLDEFSLLRTKSWLRLVLLAILCCVLFGFGLLLTTQGGLYLIELLDKFCVGVPLLVVGLFMCMGLAWIFDVRQFCTDIHQMIGSRVSIWWRAMWVFCTPAIIVSMLILHMIEGINLNSGNFPDWSQSIGIVLMLLSLVPIPVMAIFKLVTSQGSLLERLKMSCEPADDWCPSTATNLWRDVDFYPTLGGTQSTPSSSCPESPVLPRKIENPHLSRLKVLEHTSYFSFPGILSTKKHMDMRQRAILNQAYSTSNGSIDKVPHHVTINDNHHKAAVMFIAKKIEGVETCDKEVQTDAKSFVRALKRGSLKSKPVLHQLTVQEPHSILKNAKRKGIVEIEDFSWPTSPEKKPGAKDKKSHSIFPSNKKQVVEVEVQVERL